MAEEDLDGTTGGLVNPTTPKPKTEPKKAGSGDAPSGGGTGGLNLDSGATGSGTVDWNADVTTSELDAQKVAIEGSGPDSLGLHAIFGNKNPLTIGAYRAAVAGLTDAQQQQLAGVLVDAGVVAGKSTPFTTSEVETALTDALTEASQAAAKTANQSATPGATPTPNLTTYLSGQIAQRNAANTGANTADVNDLVSSMQTIADDYQIPGTASGLQQQAQQYLAAGLSSTEAEANYKQAAQAQAAGLYPNFAAQIDSGVTTKTLLDPYASLAEKTLGVDPSTINWQSPLWAAALNGPVDQGTNRASVASLSQFSQTLMSNPAYGYQNTQEANNAAGSLTASLLKLFGKLPDETLSTSISGPAPDLSAT